MAQQAQPAQQAAAIGPGATEMAASIIVFLSSIQIRRAVELSVFPTLLLLLTLFRLALNIASSRRILLHGSEGTAAAGRVIEAFGQFVVGGIRERFEMLTLRDSLQVVRDPRNLDESVREVFETMLGVR